MYKIVNVLSALKEAKKRHWLEAIYWLMFTIFGSGLPVYGGWFFLTLLSHRVGFMDFCRGGEFALYSAAILGATLHLISKGGYKEMFINMRCFVLVSFILLVFASLVFAGATAASASDRGEISIIVNPILLVASSILILTLTIIVAFFVTLIDSVRFSPDLREIERNGIEKLSQDFDTTGDKDEQ
jgi:hypothetical protein